ncbi:MAG: glycosyltransferase family 2 protein [Bacteroidaceae bacterium]|nr:glycosyltransferase family 2 protein [Bacteroidaceae bacterium]
MKVSVLVAVYNAEKYLRECLESLINQTHRDLQIVCIDDASTDASWQILQEYARKDGRIVLIKQNENKGIADTRNRGLQIAEGDYVTMLDSDDWLGTDALEQACKVASAKEDNDCVLLDVCQYDEVTGKTSGYNYCTEEEDFTGNEAFRLSLDWGIHGLYIVRSSIHKQYPYDTTCRFYSDENTTRLHFLHSRRVVRCHGIYYYRQHANSVTHVVSSTRFMSLPAHYSMKQTMLAEGVSEILLNQYEEHRWRNLVGLYVFYRTNRSAFSGEERRSIKEKLRYFHTTIEPHRLPVGLRRKFGYIPSPSFPRLYEVQNWLYLTIRRLSYHLRGKRSPEENA